MGWQAWFTLALIVFLFASLVRGRAPADMVLLGGAVLLALVGVITPEEAVRGFSNPGMLTIAALFIVSAAMRETGALDRLSERALGGVHTERGALGWLAAQVCGLSAFLNNTAVVSMLLPMVSDWCRKHRISPSRLLLPLSYFSILGGVCTLIGTSTNLVVYGLLRDHIALNAPEAPLTIRLFDFAWVGVPVTLAGVGYLLLVGRRLLPNREDLIESLGDRTRDYLVEMVVRNDCPLVGKSVEQAGLRRLPGLFLTEISREGRVVAPVTPKEVLMTGDRLAFAGVVSTIVDLERIPGLVPAGTHEASDDADARRSRRYCEAVVSAASPLIDKTIRDANFRAVYNAAVVAVHRGKARLEGRIGDIKLRAGDTLLLLTGPNFAAANRNNPDFVLVSAIEDTRPVRHERSTLALLLLAALVGLLAFGERWGVPPHLAGFLVAGLMLITRCISVGDARRAVHLEVLFAIVAAFAIGVAIESSGLAGHLAGLIELVAAGQHPLVALGLVYLVTLVITELVTNNAAAVLVFPIAMALAEKLGMAPLPFVFTIAYAASLGFATPIGYQTNLMVWGPGGYRFLDFMKVGAPLDVLLGGLAVVLVYACWG